MRIGAGYQILTHTPPKHRDLHPPYALGQDGFRDFEGRRRSAFVELDVSVLQEPW